MDSALSQIVIKIDGQKTKSKSVASPSGDDSTENPDENNTGAGGLEQAVRRIIAPASIIHFANRYFQNNVGFSTVELRTGAREYEQKLQFGMQIANKVASTALAFTANPVLGAVTLGFNVINSVIDISQRAREIGIKEDREDIALGFSRARAGFINPVATRGGRE